MDFDNENNFDMDMNNEINENNEIDDNEEENNNYNEMGEEEENENENEMDNPNQDYNNDINYDENVFNNQIEQENQNFDENDLYTLNMDNIRLKNKIQNLNNILQQKNGEINNLKIYYSKQIQLLNQNLIKYKKMEQNYINLQNEINLTKQKYLKEIKNKNNIIYNLQKGVDIKDIKLSNLTLEESQNSDFIFALSQQIKSIKQEILEEPDSEQLNQDYFQKLTNEQQIQFILNEINMLSQKLSEYKNNNMKEIVHLRKLIESNDTKQKAVKDQYYLNIIDLKKNLTQNNINDIKFPDYSLNDKDETRKNNIYNTIKILVEYIINNKKNDSEKNNKDEELNKRLKEMSELLSKNNQNLSISTKNNNELKIKYKELKDEYDSLLNKNESEKKKYINDLNKKNQQIKSLEHINTKLSNQINENKIENKKNLNNKKPPQKYGKISKNKNNKKNEINIETKLNSGKGLFNKDEKFEKNLEKFLNRFTNGEYETFVKNKNNENIDLDNLKDEIDKFNKKINKDLDLAEKK